MCHYRNEQLNGVDHSRVNGRSAQFQAVPLYRHNVLFSVSRFQPHPAMIAGMMDPTKAAAHGISFSMSHQRRKRRVLIYTASGTEVGTRIANHSFLPLPYVLIKSIFYLVNIACKALVLKQKAIFNFRFARLSTNSNRKDTSQLRKESKWAKWPDFLLHRWAVRRSGRMEISRLYARPQIRILTVRLACQIIKCKCWC